MLVAWILCAIRKVSLRVARGALAGVGRGGGWVCHRLGGGGIEAPPFPIPLPRGDLASGIPSSGRDLGSAIPHPPRRRGPCNNWKKAHRAPCGALCFFVHRPSLMQASLQRSVRVQKKALKRCLRAFFRCCGERGIRTPGTVTRTSV